MSKTPVEQYQDEVENASHSERIYEPKYGGKDHSGYDTMMKYEINYERQEAFCRGVAWAAKHPPPHVVALVEALHNANATMVSAQLLAESAINHSMGLIQMRAKELMDESERRMREIDSRLAAYEEAVNGK